MYVLVDVLTYIDQLLRGRTGDVAVADAVGDDGDVVAELGACAGGVGDANVGLGVRTWLEGEMGRCGSYEIWDGNAYHVS